MLSSVPMKKGHLSVDAVEITKTTYSSSLNRWLNASVAVSKMYDLANKPLTTVK